jgi:hypothetical protein
MRPGWRLRWLGRCLEARPFRLGKQEARPRPLTPRAQAAHRLRLQLDNPPLLVVATVSVSSSTPPSPATRTSRAKSASSNWPNPKVRQILKWVFTDPEKLRPEKSTAAITAQAAGQFAHLAAAMRGRGQDGQRVAHFLVQCLFCMFAEDEQLLPAGIFTDLLKNAGGDTEQSRPPHRKAVRRHAEKRRRLRRPRHPLVQRRPLQSAIDIPALTAADLAALHRAAADMDWRAIDPTIFGTLFERGLDPAARAPLGAHYTDTGTIAKLIDPLVREPLARRMGKCAPSRRRPGRAPKAEGKAARAAYQGFLLRLDHFRVLDPACGSGNFLYLALAKPCATSRNAPTSTPRNSASAPNSVMQTGPHNILGLEINEFAAELARVTVWIGDIQWCRRNGYPHAVNPILKPLDGIEHRDALLNPDGSEADWPTADVIVGNPPFLGDKVMRSELGDDYVETLRKTYDGRVPGGADLVTYWFEKARAQIEAGKLQAAGLVSTNSIRGGANRKVLERIVETTRIFEAWSDEGMGQRRRRRARFTLGFGPIFRLTVAAGWMGLKWRRFTPI